MLSWGHFHVASLEAQVPNGVYLTFLEAIVLLNKLLNAVIQRNRSFQLLVHLQCHPVFSWPLLVISEKKVGFHKLGRNPYHCLKVLPENTVFFFYFSQNFLQGTYTHVFGCFSQKLCRKLASSAFSILQIERAGLWPLASTQYYGNLAWVNLASLMLALCYIDYISVKLYKARLYKCESTWPTVDVRWCFIKSTN